MALGNPSFETAGASTGLAGSWTSSFVASIESFPSFSASGAQDPTEDFEDGWLNTGYLLTFASTDVTVGDFNSGDLLSQYDGFEVQWGNNEDYETTIGSATQGEFSAALLTADAFEVEWAITRVKVDFSTDLITAIDDALADLVHRLGNGTPVRFATRGTYPAPLVAGTTYYVRDATTYTFKLAATLGGAAVNLTTSGSGTFYVDRVQMTTLATGQATAGVFDNATGTDDLESGWGNDDYLYELADIDVTLAMFDDGNEPAENFEEVLGTFHFTALAATDVCTSAGHGLTNGKIVRVAGPGLPAGISAGISYHVVSASTDTFKLSLTLGGAAIDLTSDALTGTATVFGNPIYYWNDVE